jgi:hypothetical protein
MSWFRTLGDRLVHDTEGGWQTQAACAGRWDLFTETRFDHEHGDLKVLRQVRKICAECPVKQVCYETGTFEAAGVWGGRQRTLESAIKERKMKAARHGS